MSSTEDNAANSHTAESKIRGLRWHQYLNCYSILEDWIVFYTFECIAYLHLSCFQTFCNCQYILEWNHLTGIELNQFIQFIFQTVSSDKLPPELNIDPMAISFQKSTSAPNCWTVRNSCQQHRYGKIFRSFDSPIKHQSPYLYNWTISQILTFLILYKNYNNEESIQIKIRASIPQVRIFRS